MNSRILMTFGVLVALVLFAGETFAGRGGGKGNGGGGGGGGDPEPTPPGTLYFILEGLGTFTMDADGGDKTAAITGGAPTYELHSGARYVTNRRTNATELVAVRDDGAEFLLWSDAGVWIAGPRRWAKDDSFIGFRVDDLTTGTSELVRLFVDWSSGLPVPGALEVMVPHNPSQQYAGGFDFSPDGNEIVYVDNFGSDLWIRNLTTGAARVLVTPGTAPTWAPDGSAIAYKWDGIKSISPDGTALVTLRSANAFDDTASPHFSPDSQHVAFIELITKGKGKKATTQAEVVRVPATGGSIVVLTDDVDVDVTSLRGWR